MKPIDQIERIRQKVQGLLRKQANLEKENGKLRAGGGTPPQHFKNESSQLCRRSPSACGIALTGKMPAVITRDPCFKTQQKAPEFRRGIHH
jgi:hypothetical protein